MSTLATTNIKHESASTPNITLTSGGATTVNGTLNLGSSPLATPTGSAPSYTCRAWVNFNGTGTVAIRASGNVSSVTKNGTGNYSVNFTTAMPDANYATSGTCQRNSSDYNLELRLPNAGIYNASSVQVLTANSTAVSLEDSPLVSVMVTR
jgi:hypothetical protein